MTGVRIAMIVVIAAGLIGWLGCAESNEAAFQKMETQCRELPMEARRITGPLFWLHGDESKERLQQYVKIVAEGGNGSFTAESRPHQDWLGEGWWRDLAICLDAAKKNDLQMWIFDEKWWPSGEVGGKVPQAYSSKTMVATEQETTGPAVFDADGLESKSFIALIAGKVTEDGIDGDSLVDLAGEIKDGKIIWEVPEGKWKVMRFEWKYSRMAGKGANLLVDGADPEATDWYIRTVYQPHYDRFKNDFGKTIPGFFYDEPETQGDWGPAVIPMLKERGIDWKKALVAWKFKLAGEQQAAAKYQYQDAFAEAWGKTLFGGITEWCHKHKVRSIGHFLEHSWEYLNPNLCAGNMFQLLKYSDMGSIDAVFTQFIQGQRDPGLWQTPKHASSISHVYGKKDDIAMVEIFGARGQDLTYPEMKWWTDHMFVSGVNFMIPHSFNPKSPFDTDCPPYFYNGGYEPRWPLYRVYADYASRLSVLLSGGRHVCPVALLYLGNSRHVGKAITPEQMSTALQDALFDFDWLPYDAWEADTKIDGRTLHLHGEQYRVLIVPSVEVIPYATLEKAKAFFDAGGLVIGYGFLPTLSATLGKDSKDIAAIRQAVWGAPKPGMAVCKTNAKGGRSYLLPQEPTVAQIQAAMKDAGVTATMEVLEGVTDNWLHVVHRVKTGRDVFFVCNQNITPGARTYRLRFHAAGVPELWDVMRNEIYSVAYNRIGDAADISITLEPYQSAVFVFNPEDRKLPSELDSKRAGNKEIALISDPLPESPLAVPPQETESGDQLQGLKWVWMPGGNPAATAKPGTCFFRKRMELPANTKIKSAKFIGTADNAMLLWVNGKRIDSTGQGFDNWKEISKTELTGFFFPGTNVMAISVANGSDQPNPAGLIGKFIVELETGSKVVAAIDGSWKVSEQDAVGWQASDFDDNGWATAAEFAAYGEGPWKTISGRSLTLSPIQRATPYEGHCEIAASGQRALLVMDGIGPETAARVTVNGKYAGGFLAGPSTLEITEWIKNGTNRIRVEPFGPKTIKIVLY